MSTPVENYAERLGEHVLLERAVRAAVRAYRDTPYDANNEKPYEAAYRFLLDRVGDLRQAADELAEKLCARDQDLARKREATSGR
jgi:hypothetical protein